MYRAVLGRDGPPSGKFEKKNRERNRVLEKNMKEGLKIQDGKKTINKRWCSELDEQLKDFF